MIAALDIALWCLTMIAVITGILTAATLAVSAGARLVHWHRKNRNLAAIRARAAAATLRADARTGRSCAYCMTGSPLLTCTCTRECGWPTCIHGAYAASVASPEWTRELAEVGADHLTAEEDSDA